ncbi:aspartate/glutamate racemase family protein [Mesorhizobium sp. CAU 1732]|uniref:aspartate/glutamate racemase family protein n=1 Tax=Mesorhizobium sp. CAU 1732 TaxID=3140358 RepID=UPI003260EBE7
MKTIGLLGGMSWESTAIYYRHLNEMARERLGGLHSASLLIRSFDFAEIADRQHAGDWDGAGAILTEAARRLEDAGAGVMVIATNTMHLVADQVQAAISIPLIHIADATAAAVTRAGSRRPALLATRFTMEEDFYKGRLSARHGLDAVVPDAAGRAMVHRVIYDELCQGIVSAPSKAAYLAEIERMRRDDGIDGVIMGCTEITMLIGQEDIDLPAFDTTRIHAEAAFEAALA